MDESLFLHKVENYLPSALLKKHVNYSYCQNLFIQNFNLNSRLRFLQNINRSKNYCTY